MNRRWAAVGLMAGMLTGCATHAQHDQAMKDGVAQAASAPWDETEARRLEKFAISECLASAFAGSPVESDAHRASGGYVELGTSPAETYDDIVNLVQAHRATPYHSKSGKSLFVMQCLDLLHQPALEALIRPEG